MKTEIKTMTILRVDYRQEPGDAQYGSCLWATFDFDTVRYMLNIQSDCGNAGYRWPVTPETESFLQLMGRIDGDYLAGKLFKDNILDKEATLREIREWLGIGENEDERDDDLTDQERICRENTLNELRSDFDEYTWMGYDLALRIAEEWQREHGYYMDSLYDRIITDYTPAQKWLVKVFTEHVQPVIRQFGENYYPEVEK